MGNAKREIIILLRQIPLEIFCGLLFVNSYFYKLKIQERKLSRMKLPTFSRYFSHMSSCITTCSISLLYFA